MKLKSAVEMLKEARGQISVQKPKESKVQKSGNLRPQRNSKLMKKAPPERGKVVPVMA